MIRAEHLVLAVILAENLALKLRLLENSLALTADAARVGAHCATPNKAVQSGRGVLGATRRAGMSSGAW